MSPLKFLFLCIVVGGLFFFSIFLGVQMGWFSTPSLAWEIILVNVLATAAIYRWLLKIHRIQLFNNAYLGSIVLKLFFYCGVLITIRIINPNTLLPNAILLLLCYAVFTILEVTFLFLKVSR